MVASPPSRQRSAATTAISEPVVDNAAYGYEVYCGFEGTPAEALLQLFAVTVEYTVSGLPVI